MTPWPLPAENFILNAVAYDHSPINGCAYVLDDQELSGRAEQFKSGHHRSRYDDKSVILTMTGRVTGMGPSGGPRNQLEHRRPRYSALMLRSLATLRHMAKSERTMPAN